MKNIELHAYPAGGEVQVLELMFLKDKIDNVKIKYYNYLLEKLSPSEIVEKIKNQVTKKYFNCVATIDVNMMYQNLIRNLNNAHLEII